MTRSRPYRNVNAARRRAHQIMSERGIDGLSAWTLACAEQDGIPVRDAVLRQMSERPYRQAGPGELRTGPQFGPAPSRPARPEPVADFSEPWDPPANPVEEAEGRLWAMGRFPDGSGRWYADLKRETIATSERRALEARQQREARFSERRSGLDDGAIARRARALLASEKPTRAESDGEWNKRHREAILRAARERRG